MSGRIQIAVCADLDLGVIDGATIWMQSLALTLAWCNEVTVVSRAPVTRDSITGPLRKARDVHLVLPDAPLTQAELIETLVRLDATRHFDVVIVRGVAQCLRAARRFPGRLWSYLTDVPQRRVDLTGIARAKLAAIAGPSRHVLCQTEALRAYLESYIPGVDGKAILLPPMIPDAPAHAPSGEPVLRVGYAGKLAPSWRTLEMVEAVARIRTCTPAIELHIIGDKLFGPPGWAARMQRALDTTPGVIWHRGRSREETLAILAKLDLALSVRGPELDDSLELSTKLLEYGAVGLPVLLNRTAMHEELLGADYPLFADPGDLEAAILRADDDLRRTAAARTLTASRGFTFHAVAERLQPWIAAAASNAPLVPDLARPKTAGAEHRIGLLDPAALPTALAHLARLRAEDPRYRLHVRGTPPAVPADDAVSVDGAAPLGAWLRKIGLVLATNPESERVAAASGARSLSIASGSAR